jgi:hypothetical protein
VILELLHPLFERVDGYDVWLNPTQVPIVGLMRRGWHRNSLQIGDEVSVSGTRARDGSFKGNARTVEFASGETLFAGSSQDTEND